MLRALFLTFFLMMSQVQAAHAGLFPEALANEADDAEFLDPDQAFKLNLTAIDQNTLKAAFTVAPDYHLYRERISFKLKEGSGGEITETAFPKGEMIQDPNFGQMEVYKHDFEATAKLKFSGATPEKITVLASYQGCSEKGLCYPPIKKTIEISLPGSVQATDAKSADGGSSVSSEAASGDDEVQSLLKGGKFWLVILGFFGFGLLLSLTPCVFPMIPILSGIIVGQGQHPTRMHAFNLSVAYTLGMAISYTIAGIAAGLSGHLISSALQNPWVLGSSAFVFVLLSLSMFGFYELQLPSAMESGVLNFTNRIKGGRFFGVFVMGILSALIVSPCVAAPLAGALIYIGQTHNVVLGGVALFSLSIGMGVPLLIVGASAGALLPRAGAWMEAVRNFFGVMMLAMAIWLVSPVIPVKVQMFMWAALLIVSSIYLHALDTLPAHHTKWNKFWKGVGVILLLTGVSMFLGAITGSTNPLQPLAAMTSTVAEAKEAPSASLTFKRIKTVQELDAQIAEAHGKSVMLDFYADWCTSCKEYEHITFADAKVKARLANAVLLQADVTQNTAEDAALLKRFKLFGPPGIIFFDMHGNEIEPAKVIGFQEPEKFLASLSKAVQ